MSAHHPVWAQGKVHCPWALFHAQDYGDIGVQTSFFTVTWTTYSGPIPWCTALIATVTYEMRKDTIDYLDMQGCATISASTLFINEYHWKYTMAPITDEVSENGVKDDRLII